MLSRLRIYHDKPVEIGSYIKYKNSMLSQKGFGEVVGIIGSGDRCKYEIIHLNKRLKCIMNTNMKYKTRTVHSKYCKHVNILPTPTPKDHFEIGDVVCYKRMMFPRYGAVVGFTHPDGLYTSSYEEGYNGTDLIECVEVDPRDLTRVRDRNNTIKKFTTTKYRLKLCKVDLWGEHGVTMI